MFESATYGVLFFWRVGLNMSFHIAQELYIDSLRSPETKESCLAPREFMRGHLRIQMFF